MASSRCNLHKGSELQEVIRVVLGDTGVIAGAISGRALYDGAIDLAQALKSLIN